ncbi:MAG: Unknown protein [uncultured Aureispira sp.]|uniref:Uncharacterized protein n=1 Tax=uncultured Aureispira sp. TaxID=1331704 RepID=A0A6S6U2A8_9BACT|nr:MAG: Unknown protein [uncultured Aureispira sp.]
MKALFLIMSMSIISWTSYAHAPNEAFFEFFESNNELLIKAEFPWTIREVLLAARPQLKNAQTKEDMTAGLLSYLQEHLELRNAQNQQILIKSIKAAPNTNGHSHGSVYMLLLGKNQWISSIKNTCMFEAYSDQTNFHSIEVANASTLKFVTNKERATYTIKTNLAESVTEQRSKTYILIGLAILFCLIILVLWAKRKGSLALL